MKTAIASIVLFLAATFALGDDDPADGDLAGVYHLRSVDTEGAVSYGVAIIENVGDKVYMHQVFGAKSILCTGIRDGDRVAMSFPSSNGRSGATIYTYDAKNKTLTGRWVVGGSEGTETARFLRNIKDKEL